MIISRTPFRITIGGGGTDLPSYYKECGGNLISLAIDKYMYISLKPTVIEDLLKLRYSITEIVNDASLLKHDRAKASLLLHKLNSRLEINSCADLPASSGMGSSGSFLVGLLNCIRTYKKINSEPKVLAEEACDIEINKLKHPVGKQDQYIAAYGGLKRLEIEKNGNVNVSELNITKSNLLNFLSNIQIFYLNHSRDASTILKDAQKNTNHSNKIFDIVKRQSYDVINFLEKGQYDDYGLLLDEYWSIKKKLSPKISFESVDNLYTFLKNEYNILGGKIIGAGGGGFLLVYANKNKEEIARYMENNNYKKLHFTCDEKGSTITTNL